jgi:membrane-bound serine protease (ClpP class)
MALAMAAVAWSAALAQPPGRAIVVAEYDGIIHPVASEFIDDTLTRAESNSAVAMVLILRTPGGLLESTREIVSRMISAKLPVVVFVAPQGSRAASAGFLILLAADVAVMAPGTHAGAAHPVAAGGQPPAEIMLEKATEDTAAYARTLAQMRNRNGTLAAEAVVKSRAFTEREALAASPPLIDLVASDLGDLLRRLDGRRVSRAGGQTFVIETAGVSVDRVQMTWRQRFLSAIAHPQVAYLLITLGMLGLVVELWNPGAVLPGVVGGLCLLLAFFAFQVLPVNTAGFLLIAFGLALLALEVAAPSFGVLGIGGALALFFGSVMITREVPGVRVSYDVIVPVVVALALISLFLGRLALRAQRAKPTTGAEGLVGARAVTVTALGHGHDGQVQVHGELWRAVSPVDVPARHFVRVTALDGLTLHVEPVDPLGAQGDTP